MLTKKINFSKLKGKKVLLRIDTNSAIYKRKVISGPRFEAHAKTIKLLSKYGAKIIVLAHQGRPGNKDYLVNLSQHAKILKKLSGVNVKYVDGLFEKNVLKKVEGLKEGNAILLKNVRSYKDEIKVDNPKNKFFNFSKNFDMYVNDAFSICHRSQGSIIIPPKVIPSYPGPVISQEILGIDKFNLHKDKKLAILLGGAKIGDYSCLFKKFKNKDSIFLLGGVPGNLFLSEKGAQFGYEEKWMKEQGHFEDFKKIKKIISPKSKKLILPEDFAVKEKGRKEISLNDLPENKKIMDIGKGTIEKFKKEISNVDAILVKGPMGFSEMPGFEKGTVEVLKEIAKRTKQKKLYSLVGGGHSTTTIEKFNISGFSHLSLSGGALIKYVCGEKLPGLEALK